MGLNLLNGTKFNNKSGIDRKFGLRLNRLPFDTVSFSSMKKSQLLLETIGIEVEEDKNGKLILGEYRQPSANFKFDDIEINEDKLFKDIVEIKGNADFEFSKSQTLVICKVSEVMPILHALT